jgi:hypothetical protein
LLLLLLLLPLPLLLFVGCVGVVAVVAGVVFVVVVGGGIDLTCLDPPLHKQAVHIDLFSFSIHLIAIGLKVLLCLFSLPRLKRSFKHSHQVATRPLTW